jgi:DNA primase
MDIRGYFKERFDVGYARNNNIRLLDCECPWCGGEGKVYIKCDNWGVGVCHKCGTSFRGVDFVMEYEGCTPDEAFKLLKGEAVDTWVSPTAPAEDPKADGPYFPELEELSTLGRGYLNSRGLNDAIIKKYKFVSCNHNGVYAGKIVYSRDRVIIPIFDISGKLVSWQGRSLDPASKVKYLFSPDFKKSEHLYNSWNIKPNPDYLVLCEGVFDCLGWIRNGFANCVASFGKMISEKQVGMLKALKPKVLFIAWDYDCLFEMSEFAGKYGQFFDEIRIVRLPNGKDSDECQQKELLQVFSLAKAPSWKEKILSRL